ncbi:MAG: acyl carrier protein [Ruminococcaceae bacterium]|nr:acyl carrier protein [Oscillospiraceae bacterium]
MDKLVQILKEIRPGIDFENQSGLVDNDFLNSLDIVALITEINDEFDVIIPPEEITPENFNSAKAIYELINRLQK